MNKNKGELLEELLKKRIRFLESEIAKIDVGAQKNTMIKVSMQGGIIELKKLLNSVEKTKALVNFSLN